MSTRAPRGRERLVGTPQLPDRAPPPVAVPPETEEPLVRRRRGRFVAARSVRAKILAVVILLLAASAALSTFVIRQLLLSRLNDRIEDAGQQEVLELDRLLAVGQDPATGLPFDSPAALFDAYLARNVPSSEEALLTFVDGRFHRSALARFPLDHLPPAQLADWADLATESPDESERVSGEFETEIGKAHF